MTHEELELSLPYSETREWARLLISQSLRGRSRFLGPPGLSAKVADRLSCITEQEKTSLYFDPDTLVASIMDGSAAAST